MAGGVIVGRVLERLFMDAGRDIKRRAAIVATQEKASAEMSKSVKSKNELDIEYWFLAELIVAHKSTEWESQLVHINYVLLQASDNDSAYTKAKVYGEAYAVKLRNSDGEEVDITFEGVRELYPLGLVLSDGLELFYQELNDVSKATIAQWIVPREELRAFANGRAKEDLH
jgi:hypothetical protein